MTNTQSAALGPNQERRLKTLQKKTFHKNGNSKTASIPHGWLTDAQQSRAVDTLLLCSENNYPSETRKSFHFLLCFWCLWALLPHRHSVCFAHTQKCSVIFCCVWCFWVSDIICWKQLTLKINRTSADWCNVHMWMGWADDTHLLVCNDLHCYT